MGLLSGLTYKFTASITKIHDAEQFRLDILDVLRKHNFMGEDGVTTCIVIDFDDSDNESTIKLITKHSESIETYQSLGEQE